MAAVAINLEEHAQQQKDALLRLGISEEKAEEQRLKILAEAVTRGTPGDPQFKS